ncbi:MAG: phage/plasmid replication protein [Bacteroidota bacterium]
MYDNIDFNLKREQAGNIDLLAEVPLLLKNTSEHSFNDNSSVSVTGYIDKFKVNVTESRVKITEGSLCKELLNDNFQTLTRGDTKRAIEKISDLLHLPVHKADIERIDLAQNFIVRHETPVYYNHLGLLQYYNRLEQNKGLYYNNNNRLLVFYDKVAEYKHKGLPVPELYQNRNVLRYEMRFTRQLLKQFNTPQLIAEMLYDEQFYIDIINRWYFEYKNINKIREKNNIDYTMIKTREQLKQQALLLLIHEQGGELEFYKTISEAQQKNELTNKQAYDLRHLIKEAGQSKLLTCESDVITELDKKVKEAIKFYR